MRDSAVSEEVGTATFLNIMLRNLTSFTSMSMIFEF